MPRKTACLLIILPASVTDAAQEESEGRTPRGVIQLQNDGFMSGGTAGFQGGLASGERIAAKFVAGSLFYPLAVTRVRFLFGPNAVEAEAVVRVHADSAAQDIPGNESPAYTITGSSSAFTEIFLPPGIVVLDDGFWVSLEMDHDGPPSLAVDIDGLTPNRNAVFQSSTWFPSSLFALTGDWILRVSANPNVEDPTIFFDGFETSDTTAWDAVVP